MASEIGSQPTWRIPCYNPPLIGAEIEQPNPDSAMAFDRDDTSDIEDEVQIIREDGSHAQGADSEDDELSADADVSELSQSTVERAFHGVNLNGYTPHQDEHHEREIFLPANFYNQPDPLKPSSCDCQQSGRSDCCASRNEGDGNGPQSVRFDLPLLFFKLFFSNAVFAVMAYNTNAYALLYNAGEAENGRPWKDVTAAELKIWIGLIIYMSVIRQARLPEFWYRNCDWPTHCITRFMSLRRFEQIKRYFHVSPPFRDLPKEHFFDKLEPVSSMVKAAFQRVVRPATQVSVDEMIIRFTGRSSHTIMMRGKPVPEGYNVLALCEGGYCWSWKWTSPQLSEVYSVVANSAPEAAMTNLLSKLSRGVLDLMLQLPYKQHFFILFCDNLFSNADLFHILRAYGIAACGTTRATYRNWPTIFKEKIERKKTRLPYNTVLAEVVHGDVAAIVWQDKNLVQFLTTTHNPLSTVLITRRRPVAKTKWLKAAVEKIWGSKGKVDVRHPTFSVDYNNYMGGVDRHDQLRSYASTQLVSIKAWYSLFFFLLDAAVINAFIICKQLHQASKQHFIQRQRYFRMRLAWNLILEGARDIDTDWATSIATSPKGGPRYKGRFQAGNTPSGNTSRSRARGYITRNWQPPATRLTPGNHQLDKWYRRSQCCCVCRYRNRHDKQYKVKTSVKCCLTCGPHYPLCEACEPIFHSEQTTGISPLY